MTKVGERYIANAMSCQKMAEMGGREGIPGTSASCQELGEMEGKKRQS